jgi:hypothetical protein
MSGSSRTPGVWGNKASWAFLKPMGFTPELNQYRFTWDEYIPPEEDA